MKTMKRLAAFALALCIVASLLPQLSIKAEAATAQSASFISRTDGVWLWPTTYYAVSDWAGCNASPTSNSYCHFCGIQHGLCGANHLTTLGHNGVDIPVGIGSEVYAAASGTLYCTNTDWAYRGKTAVVEHPIAGTGWSYYSIYQHLNSTVTTKNGKAVSVGEVIAWSGNTDGFGTGQAHLHFGLLMAASGQGNALAQNPNANITAIENYGWIKTSGYAVGRILVNPALNSPAGDPTYTDGCRNNVRTHAGSIMYTRNKSEVSIGSDSVPVAAYDELIATDDGLYVRGWAFDPDTVNEYVGIQVYLNGEYWKTIVANTSRPDVHSAHGCGENHGFAFEIPVTKAGAYSVHLYAVNTTAGAANLDMGSKEITITHTHSYRETYTQKTTCTTAGYTIYTCSGCGDSYTEYPGQWSQWSTEYPTGVPEGLIQQKTQYKNRKKKYTTSTEATLEGWTNCGTDISDWSAEKTTTSKPTESDNLRITKTTQTGWGYYHYCNYYSGCWNVDSITYGSGNHYHSCVTNFEIPASSIADKGGRQSYGGTGSGAPACGYNFYYWFRNPSADVYTYTYQTREIVNRFYQWSGWSSWQDEKPTSSENRQVKTQTVYRYNISADACHTYKDDCDTSCNVCGAKREAKHTYISNCDASCGICGAIRTNASKHTLASNGICLHCNTTFGDVSLNSWQIGPVVYTYNTGLMAGKGTDAQGRIKFDPNSPISREEFVQVLYNAEGKPSVTIANNFPDVANNGWYKNAVLWANKNNIANGMGNGNFGVGKSITRQDLALMLYKYAVMKNLDMTAPTGEINKYADGSKVSGYAQTAMNWAVKNGVLSGKGEAGKPLSTFRLDPAGTATRAECAAMLKNFMTAFGL